MKLRQISEGILCGSPSPKKGDASSIFPYFCELDDGTLLATHVRGSGFDMPDCRTYVSRSTDGGWTFLHGETPLGDFSGEPYPITDAVKLTNAGGQHVIGIGYGFSLSRGSEGPGNPATGGALDSPIFFFESFDGGRTFAKPVHLKTAWGDHCEASGPLLVLPNGDYIAPTAAFMDWEGRFTSPMCGRIIRSRDGGRTWNDDTVAMRFPEGWTVWEQRLCRTESGRIVDIAWVEDLKTGELHNNQAAISQDGGYTFSAPIDTGVHGQASSVCAIGGERIVAFHSMRRHVERYGVQACIVNVADGRWEIEQTQMVWEPPFAMTKNKGALDVFAMLKFGQPSAILLRDGTLLYTQWLMENDVCRTIWKRFALEN